MKYMDHDLGQQPANALVTVSLSGTEANVFLVDAINFQHYRNARKYQYFGGHYKRSPVQLTVPHAGHWHCVVDLGGYTGHVDVSVSVAA